MKQFGGMQNLLKQANQMQSKMKKVQEELAAKEFEASSGGAVTVKVNGSQQIMAITISPDVFKSADADMLSDMILTAANEALKTAKATSEQEMAKITGGFSVPGMF